MVDSTKVFGIISACFNVLATVVFMIIVLVAIRLRRERTDISLLLTINTCLASLLTCLAVCIMISSNFWSGFLTVNLEFCFIWGLLYDIFQCSIYHSYFLQALFRLCRVVFYRKKSLLSFSLYQALIIVQWFISVLVLLPPYFLHWYMPLLTEEYCLIPYTSIGPEMYHIIILYLLPLIGIICIYVWISRFIRRSSQAAAQNLAAHLRRRNERDLAMIKRIVLMISVLVAMRFPTIIFMIYAAITRYLHPITFSVVGVITSICLAAVGVMTVYFTPKLHNNLCCIMNMADNRIHVRQNVRPRVQPATTTDSGVIAQQLKSRTVRTDGGQGLNRSTANAFVAQT